MGRKANGKNKSFYHYKVTDLKSDDGMVKYKYYMTLYDVAKDFDCTTRCVNDRINSDQTRKGIRKMKFDNFLVEKVSKPRYKLICIDEQLIE
jgi:hypothetical protein